MNYKQQINKLITYQDLENLPLNLEIDFSPKKDKSILCTRLSNTSSGMTFRVYMSEGTVWEDHYHDCEESLIVFKGRLRGILTNTIIGRGSMIDIPAEVTHRIYAEEESQFYVEFKKATRKND